MCCCEKLIKRQRNLKIELKNGLRKIISSLKKCINKTWEMIEIIEIDIFSRVGFNLGGRGIKCSFLSSKKRWRKFDLFFLLEQRKKFYSFFCRGPFDILPRLMTFFVWLLTFFTNAFYEIKLLGCFFLHVIIARRRLSRYSFFPSFLSLKQWK